MNRIAGLLPISWSNSVFLSNTEFNYTCSCRINFNYPPFNKSGIGLTRMVKTYLFPTATYHIWLKSE